MGKIPVKIKSVSYALSPYQQKAMTGLWKDFTNKMTHKFTDNWLDVLFVAGPVLGVYSYAQSYIEKEKVHHRY